jgi:hypothetical protein
LILPDSHRAFGVLRYLRNIVADHLVTMFGLTLAGLVLTAALRRVIVYPPKGDAEKSILSNPAFLARDRKCQRRRIHHSVMRYFELRG